MKEVRITWMSQCPCKHNAAIVTTRGSEEELFDGEEVYCPSCGNTGEIFSDNVNTDVIWDRQDEGFY